MIERLLYTFCIGTAIFAIWCFVAAFLAVAHLTDLGAQVAWLIGGITAIGIGVVKAWRWKP